MVREKSTVTLLPPGPPLLECCTIISPGRDRASSFPMLTTTTMILVLLLACLTPGVLGGIDYTSGSELFFKYCGDDGAKICADASPSLGVVLVQPTDTSQAISYTIKSGSTVLYTGSSTDTCKQFCASDLGGTTGSVSLSFTTARAHGVFSKLNDAVGYHIYRQGVRVKAGVTGVFNAATVVETAPMGCTTNSTMGSFSFDSATTDFSYVLGTNKADMEAPVTSVTVPYSVCQDFDFEFVLRVYGSAGYGSGVHNFETLPGVSFSVYYADSEGVQQAKLPVNTVPNQKSLVVRYDSAEDSFSVLPCPLLTVDTTLEGDFLLTSAARSLTSSTGREVSGYYMCYAGLYRVSVTGDDFNANYDSIELLIDGSQLIRNDVAALTTQREFALANDLDTIEITAEGCVYLAVSIVTDAYPLETSWELYDFENTTSGSFGSGEDGNLNQSSLYFCPGNYRFRILDNYGDGLCCNYGFGNVLLQRGIDMTTVFDLESDGTLADKLFEISVQYPVVVGTDASLSFDATASIIESAATPDYQGFESNKWWLVITAANIIMILFIMVPSINEYIEYDPDEVFDDDDAVADSGPSFVSRVAARVKANKIVQFIIWGVRCMDWASDFLVIIVIVAILSSAPYFAVTIPKEAPGDIQFSFVMGGYSCPSLFEDVNYCDTDDLTVSATSFRENIIVSEYELVECKETVVDSVIEYSCRGNNENDFEVISSVEEYELRLADLNGCILGEFSSSDSFFSFDFVGTCDSDNTGAELTPEVLLVQDTIWNCFQLSQGNSECALRDAWLINAFMVLLFVLIAKEMFVMVYSEFCVYRLCFNDLSVLSADSIVLLCVYAVRVFTCLKFLNVYFEKANARMMKQPFFFFSWMAFDFTEKVASTSVTAALILNSSEINPVIAFAFGASVMGLCIGLFMWRSKMTIMVDEVKNQTFHLDALMDNSSDDDFYVGIGLSYIGKHNIQREFGSTNIIFYYVRRIILKIWGYIMTLIELHSLAIVVFLILPQYGAIRTEQNFTIKMIGVVLLASLLAELGRSYYHKKKARSAMDEDLSAVFFQKGGTGVFADISRAHSAFLSKVKSKLPYKVRAISMFSKRSSFLEDVMVFGVEFAALVLLLEVYKAHYVIHLNTLICDSSDELFCSTITDDRLPCTLPYSVCEYQVTECLCDPDNRDAIVTNATSDLQYFLDYRLYLQWSYTIVAVHCAITLLKLCSGILTLLIHNSFFGKLIKKCFCLDAEPKTVVGRAVSLYHHPI